jgi:hypothetical protein
VTVLLHVCMYVCMDLDVYRYLRSQVRAKDSSMASLDRHRAANDGVLDPRQFSSGWLQRR